MTDSPEQSMDDTDLADPDQAEPTGTEEPEAREGGVPDGLGDAATGDIVIDAALQDLRDAPADDLDAQVEAGRHVHRTLQARLSDLGGE